MRRPNQGNALLITLLIMMTAAALVGIVLSETGTVARNTDRSRDYLAAQAAAEGAVEMAYAVWYKQTNNSHAMISGSIVLGTALNNIPSFTGTNAPPGTNGFVYTSDGLPTIVPLDKYGVVITGTPDPVIGRVPGYTGWWGRTYSYAATAKVMPVGGNPALAAGVRRMFQYTEVPLFQTMFFFQDDLEIYNPAQITLSGLIHSNGNMYLSSALSGTGLIINGGVTYVGSYSAGVPPGVVGTDAWKDSNGNTLAKYPAKFNGGDPRQVAALSPMGANLQADFPPPFGTNSDPAALTNANLQNGYHELIEPPSSASTDPVELSTRRLYSGAGLIIQVSGTGAISRATTAITTISASTHLPVPVAGATTLIAAQNGTVLPARTTPLTTTYTNAVNALADSLKKTPTTATTPLYDARVGAKVNVVDLDISLLGAQLSTSTNPAYPGINFNGVVYIYDNSVSGTTLNSVRLKNGKILPSDPDNVNPTQGLTIASQNPIYIWGDYNTGFNAPSTTLSTPTASSSPTGKTTSNGSVSYTRLPAAVIGDAVTLLSNAWLDANSSLSLTNNRNPTNTTYNAALLGGYMPSVANVHFSGGAINYPRYLEDWSGKYVTYFGSMVELFPSKTFTQAWTNPGNFYTAPNRFYNFDTNYSKTAPPGTVAAIVLSRGSWSKY